MRCPHCDTAINPPTSDSTWVSSREGQWQVTVMDCPECNRTTVVLRSVTPLPSGGRRTNYEAIAYPRTASRSPAPPEVDDALRSLYDEASLIAADSPRAAGALLRRALQQLIRDKAGITKRDLNKEIDELIASGQIPGYISEIVDSVRVVGNFAAHPIKSTNTGDVIDVEPGEVDLCFDVLEALFDFYFVEPARIVAKKAALNQKLQEAGKPGLK